uniref:Putative secreted protein n=1 Tax=Anopheles darlingi TaxID=43151 RepID=A0A2M4D424_ANODA
MQLCLSFLPLPSAIGRSNGRGHTGTGAGGATGYSRKNHVPARALPFVHFLFHPRSPNLGRSVSSVV